MGKEVSLFSGYGHKENRTTNYCLLILKLLYEENPKYLSEVTSRLIGEDIGSRIGVEFLQQTRKGDSVPDGIVIQKPLVVYIETKLHGEFNMDQLSRHSEALQQEKGAQKVLVALGKFISEEQKNQFDVFEEKIKSTPENELIFAAISFEEFVEALAVDGLSKNTTDAIKDFQLYLDQQNLLPTWKYRLDVVNCAKLPDDILNGEVYMCPAQGGAYSHKRSMYFGFYRNKKVEKIAIIEAVIDVEDRATGEMRWKNVEGKDEAFIQKAIEKVISLRDEYPTRVFLLGDLFDTEFRKNTRGGLMGSKVYFDVSSLHPQGGKDLALKLSGEEWSNFN